eukprot:COSAG02_NODE_1822_length_10761_cov_48.708685_6_plen_38_part_00
MTIDLDRLSRTELRRLHAWQRERWQVDLDETITNAVR